MMKKKIHIFLICTIIIVSLFVGGCAKNRELSYTLNGYTVVNKDNGVALIGVEEQTYVQDNVFIIPQKIGGREVVSIGYRKKAWVPTDDLEAVLPFQANDDIKKVVINHDILIHPYAFDDLKFLYEIEVSSSLSKSENISTFGSWYIRSLTANVETTDALNAWFWGADELRNLKLQAEQLNSLMLEKPNNLIAYFVDGAKSISDTFSKYESLSAFIIPETVTEIASGAFNDCAMDLYFRVTEENCDEKIRKELPIDCNIVWGFEDEIIIFDSLNGSDVVFEETQKNYQVVANGGSLQIPKDPTKEGYVFDGWYEDYAYSKKWDFENGIVSDSMTLVAKWVEN